MSVCVCKQGGGGESDTYRKDVIDEVRRNVVLCVDTSNGELKRLREKESTTILPWWFESGVGWLLIYPLILFGHGTDFMSGLYIIASMALFLFLSFAVALERIGGTQYYHILKDPINHGRWAFHKEKIPINIDTLRKSDSIIEEQYDYLMRQSTEGVIPVKEKFIYSLSESVVQVLQVRNVLSSSDVTNESGNDTIKKEDQ